MTKILGANPPFDHFEVDNQHFKKSIYWLIHFLRALFCTLFVGDAFSRATSVTITAAGNYVWHSDYLWWKREILRGMFLTVKEEYNIYFGNCVWHWQKIKKKKIPKGKNVHKT